MVSEDVGKGLIILGVFCIGTGLFFYLGGRIPGLDRLGDLPGDIRIEKENFRLYLPITTMLLLSILITILIRLIGYFQNGTSL
ncbi:MAG: DUF2905 family protein [Bacteroidetes bacterium]|nr:DUF2905 family protein [Bacteroidota bacterium]